MTNSSAIRCDTPGWDAKPLPAGSSRRGTPEADALIQQLVSGNRLILCQSAKLAPRERRGSDAPNVRISFDQDEDAAVVLAVRYPSNAVAFHLPSETERRGKGKPGSHTVHFTVPVSQQPVESGRRGIVSGAIKVFVLKVAGKLADKAFPVLARLWETAAWRMHKLQEGWLALSQEALRAKALPASDLKNLAVSPGRNLLFLHGTFSNAEKAFAGLTDALGSDGRDLFAALAPDYGDRIFAFNHFTVSRNPEDNVRMLLKALPARATVFDVITHSRGGLVLRHLVERRDLFGPLADRFQLGRAVLVASPNSGTPLASPQRFDKLLGWLANLAEILPENPFTFALDLVSEGLIWIAHHVAGSLPGLAAMDTGGAIIGALQSKPGPPPVSYSALVANYEPNGSLLQRITDAGIDIFFGSANDLVVPTEGGWRVDPSEAPSIPGNRIGCYGPGGNIDSPGAGAVTHGTFFSQAATVDFLVRSLRGEPHPLAPINPQLRLPFRAHRGAASIQAPDSKAIIAQPAPPAQATVQTPLAVHATASAPLDRKAYDESLILSVLPFDEETAEILATFRNARSLEKIRKKGGDEGKRWRDLIAAQRRIRDYMNGKPDVTMPQGQELVELGRKLFETIFPGEVRRLYDVARAAQSDGRLNIVLTSMIDWIADLPWEFAYDPVRKNFLALEEVNFVRNVVTAIPADHIDLRPTPMRILVVMAQPMGTAYLSVDEEIAVIKEGFQQLIDARMAVVDVLPDATPDTLHRMLEAAARPYDVLHFIGHGEFDSTAKMGYLIFQSETGGIQKLDADVLRQIVCRRQIRLVFLNCCETGEGSIADYNRGTAPALVAGGVPSVVANQYSVLDASATSFARHFYWALAQGRSIGDAARESRVTLNYSIAGEAIDWAVPVVYARNPGDALCPPWTAAGLSELDQIRVRRARRAAAPRPKRVALWDVHRIIPRMDAIASRLTAVQDQFGFEAVSLSAPIGTWQRSSEIDGIAYLRAEEVVHRLESKPGELGVEHLIAITNLPLADRETTNLSIWYDNKDDRISVFSTAGLLDQLHPPELTLERMIANTIAFVLMRNDAHEKGESDCPGFYNEDRDIRWIAGRLRLCNVCRKRIEETTLLKAVEKLLEAY